MKKILKVAITGGPCAGKTTAIQDIVREFSEKGYLVLVINETATELINSGAKCFGENKISMVDFQRYLITLQLAKEKTYEKIAENSKQSAIIICDRGLLDNKAYVTDEEYKNVLSESSLTESTALMSYDVVIHLTTAAINAEEFYTTENNKARTETKEEAIEMDKKTLSCWIGHPKLNIVDNSTNFKEKINRVINIIKRELNEEVPIRQDKYLIESIDFNELKNIYIAEQKIEEFFCNYVNKKDVMVRKTTIEDNDFYTRTEKKNITSVDIITTNKKITKEEYEREFDKKNMIPIKKTRYAFIYDNDYYKLDVFENPKLIVLEKEITNYSKESLPPFLNVKENITNDLKYRNTYLFKEINNDFENKV